jgi:hypothetical protein
VRTARNPLYTGVNLPLLPQTATFGPTPNTGTTFGADNLPQANGFSFTVPAGVLTGDVMIVILSCYTYTSAAPAVATPVSGGGPWTQLAALSDSGPSGNGTSGYGTAWYRIATAADPGSTFVTSFTGPQGATNAFYWASALQSYTNTKVANPIDVAPAPAATVSTSITFPTAVTTDNNDWTLLLIAFTGVVHTSPAGATLRQFMRSGAQNGVDIWDSNASAGPPGTTIGGQNITSGSPDLFGVFTIGLAPKIVLKAGPSYASTAATDNTGTGSWLTVGNATGPPDGNNTTWTVT